MVRNRDILALAKCVGRNTDILTLAKVRGQEYSYPDFSEKCVYRNKVPDWQRCVGRNTDILTLAKRARSKHERPDFSKGAWVGKQTS